MSNKILNKQIQFPLSGSFTGSLFGTSSYALTASYAMNGGGGGSTNTGSLLTTASVVLNTITFTKGDGSTFPITVNTGSGGGSGAGFPYSGSAVITGSLLVSGSGLTITGSTNITGDTTIKGNTTLSGNSVNVKGVISLNGIGGASTNGIVLDGSGDGFSQLYYDQNNSLGYADPTDTGPNSKTTVLSVTNGGLAFTYGEDSSQIAYLGNKYQGGPIGLVIGGTLPTFPLYTLDVNGSGRFMNGLIVTGSLNVTNGITGSLQGTASWATNFVSASNYVLNSATSSFVQNSQTSSFVLTSSLKALSGSALSFTGTPRSSSITFGSAFTNNLYAVAVIGEDARLWTIQSKTSAGFTINSNSSVALTGPVYWIATAFN
jgi:hypothetical protein